jgi:hypothetical protein
MLERISQRDGRQSARSVVVSVVIVIMIIITTFKTLFHYSNIESFQKSLRIQILRVLLVDMMRRVGCSVSHVPLIDGTNCCGG